MESSSAFTFPSPTWLPLQCPNPLTPNPQPLVLFSQEPQLRGLRFLPVVFKWTRLIMKRFNRKLDRNGARALTVGAAIADLPNGEKERKKMME